MNIQRMCWTLSASICLLMISSWAEASPYPLDQVLDTAPAEKLAKANVKTTDDLLKMGGSPKELRTLGKTTGLPATKLNTWVKMCDLLRIKGVGPEMVRLLNAGKISSVKQLRKQETVKLHKMLMAANTKAKITEKPPSVEQISHWIEQAKKLEIVIR